MIFIVIANRYKIWLGSVYFDELLTVSFNFLQNSSTKLFSKSRKSYIYFSRILLTKVSYFDVGYYYCGPMMEDEKFFEPNFKRIYVYVQGECLSKFDDRIKIIRVHFIHLS